jgi:hypothetical protein
MACMAALCKYGVAIENGAIVSSVLAKDALMQSLSYVLAAYATGFVLLGGFALRIVIQRLQLRKLITSLESQNESK